MKHTRGRTVEIDSLGDLDRRLAQGTRSMAGWRLRGLDLTGHGEELTRTDVAGALFLGCALPGGTELRRRGAIVFPTLPDVPVEVYRSRLYTPHELYDTADYQTSLDARAYAWAGTGVDPDLAAALHDHAVDVALTAWVQDRHLVGVMGGHAMRRGSSEYAFAARLGRALGRHHVVTTGGGPGAMEAANLGAYLARMPDSALDEALTELATAPSFSPDVAAWVDAAFRVLDAHPLGSDSLGIPTWHYGHEPPNPFATQIAKYFRNATREAILLEICDRGIVFLPGAAGTLQEVFQDACENYYADESAIAPMVLVGREYWTDVMPAWPLLRTLARGRPMEPHVHLVDTIEEVSAVINALEG